MRAIVAEIVGTALLVALVTLIVTFAPISGAHCNRA